MAIENTYLLGKNITLGCGFDLQAKAPLDSRQTVPAFEGLRALIIGDAAYEGMIVYDEGTKKTYQAQKCDSYTVEVDGKPKTYDIAFREFGINESELKELIASETTAAMEFKGATATLPENPAKGDMWKVTASFEVAGETTKVGDSIVYNGEEWFRIPSGDDIEDTWRVIQVEGVSLGGIADGKTLNLTAGAKLDVALAEDGTVTYSHEEIAAPTATPVGENEQTRTYIASIETDGHGHITGYKTATENVEDTNTTYTFEGQSDEATSVYFQVKSSEEESAEVIYLDAYSKNEANLEFAKKVDKAEGYSLVSDTEIARLAEVDNYNDEEVRGLIDDNADAIEDLAEYVGTIPNVPDADGNNKYADLDVIGYINKKAQETLAAASGNSSETAASVKGQLDDYIGENNKRVSDVEEAIDAINDEETGILKQAKDYADGLAGNYDEAGAAAGVQAALEGVIADKVDKVEGKSLVSDSEISKLAGVSAGANKVEASTNGKIKIDGTEVTVYSHPDKHAIDDVTDLQKALDGKVDTVTGKGLSTNDLTDELKGHYDDAYAHSVTDHAPADAQANVIESVKVNGTALTITNKTVDITVGALASKDEVAKADLADALAAEIDSKVASVTAGDASVTVAGTDTAPTIAVKLSATKGNAIELAEDGLKVIIPESTKVEASTTNGNIKVDGEEVTVYTHPTSHTASEISDFATEVAKVKVTNASKADTAGQVDNALTVKVGGTDIVFDGSEAKTADVDSAIQAAINAIPEQTDYSVSITEDTTDSTIAKRYIFTQLGEEIGRIDLAKELVVTSGSVKEVTTADAPYSGAKVGDKYIELVIANQATPIYVPAKDLVDIYTAKDAATEVQITISNTNEISATLVNGGITEEKLASDIKTKLNKTWEEVGVAQGLVDGLANGQVKLNKEAIEAINNVDTGILAKAVAADAVLKSELQGEIADAKTYAANLDAAVLAEAQAYADQVANAVNTGVMSVEAGDDIVVTPGENGKVTVSHETFTTGAYAKNPADSDKTGDVYLLTGVTVDNGHVTGANVQSLAHALMGMTFVFDGGKSTD